MGCTSGQGSIDNNCLSAQTFCLIDQYAKNNIDNTTFTQVTQGTAINKTPFTNTIKEILQNISDFGDLGTRNPTTEQIDAIPTAVSGQIISLNSYNKILEALDSSDLATYSLITASLINSIQTKIDNYKLNNDRCNNCNAQCNAQCDTCQDCVTCQSCDICNYCNTCQGCEGYTCTGACQTTYECSICHD